MTARITSRAGRLLLDGKPWTFLGLNAYELGTLWGTNSGCGLMLDDAALDAFFASLPANTLVRFWCYQTLAHDLAGALNWLPLDRVFSAAAKHKVLLLPNLTNQWGDCEDGLYKVASWYTGGFRHPGALKLSFWDWLDLVVSRYRDSPALGMWELVNEPEAAEGTPAAKIYDEGRACRAMRAFFDRVGARIHHLDPDHLVSSGCLSGGQIGTQGDDWSTVHASEGIDVCSYHDYSGTSPMGNTDPGNGTPLRLEQARALGKPIFGGECGIETIGVTVTERAQAFATKLAAQTAAGSAGILLWDYVPGTPQPNSWDIGDGDPALTLVGTH